MESVPIEERARRYVAKMPAAIAGSGGHDATFAVACVLVRGFALPADVARRLIAEFNLRCEPPWSERELEHKIQSADKGSTQERGYLIEGAANFVPSRAFQESVGWTPERSKPAPMDLEELRRLAGEWAARVDLVWLANRSALDPATVSAEGFLAALYRPGESVVVFTEQRSQGQALWPLEKLPTRGPDGVWFLPQPVDGATYPNPRTEKPSRRSEESVREFRYLVLESDDAPARPWLGLLVQLPARIEAIYTSGGRSVHALVRVGCRSKAEWDAERAGMHAALGMLFLGGLDRGVLSAVRLSRLPGCWRASKRGAQKLLYLQPGADMRPICERSPLRDVERTWGDLASLGISDADETGGAVLRRVLEFYATVSEPLRAALDNLKELAR